MAHAVKWNSQLKILLQERTQRSIPWSASFILRRQNHENLDFRVCELLLVFCHQFKIEPTYSEKNVRTICVWNSSGRIFTSRQLLNTMNKYWNSKWKQLQCRVLFLSHLQMILRFLWRSNFVKLRLFSDITFCQFKITISNRKRKLGRNSAQCPSGSYPFVNEDQTYCASRYKIHQSGNFG